MPSYFTIFECGRNLLTRPDGMYERACMANSKEKYYTKILETLVDYNDLKMHHFPFKSFSKKSVNSWQKINKKNMMPKVTPII